MLDGSYPSSSPQACFMNQNHRPPSPVASREAVQHRELAGRPPSTCPGCHPPLTSRELKGKAGGLVTALGRGEHWLSTSHLPGFWPCASPGLAAGTAPRMPGQQGGHIHQGSVGTWSPSSASLPVYPSLLFSHPLGSCPGGCV